MTFFGHYFSGVDLFIFALLGGWLFAREWLHRWRLKMKERR